MLKSIETRVSGVAIAAFLTIASLSPPTANAGTYQSGSVSGVHMFKMGTGSTAPYWYGFYHRNGYWNTTAYANAWGLPITDPRAPVLMSIANNASTGSLVIQTNYNTIHTEALQVTVSCQFCVGYSNGGRIYWQPEFISTAAI